MYQDREEVPSPTLGELWSRKVNRSIPNKVRDRLGYLAVVFWFWTRNHLLLASLIGEGPVVCLTSYGPRVSSVWLTLESIAFARTRPRRLILWLDDGFSYSRLPNSLERLRRRGLEIRFCPDYRSHKKWYPYVSALRGVHENDVFVTADDDVLYPRRWLSTLHSCHHETPLDILAFRSHVIAMRPGSILPYLEWRPTHSTEALLRNFATGVSGVLYPRDMVSALSHCSAQFMELAPSADDVWLHSVAVGHGIRTRQVEAAPQIFLEVRGSGVGGLAQANVVEGRNDAQIANVYGEQLISALMAEWKDGHAV